MATQINLRVILSAIGKEVKENQKIVAAIVATILDVTEEEILPMFGKLPVVLFDNINTENLKKIKDRLIFLSKLGLDFNITFKPFPELYRAGWQIESTIPVAFCPSCGEELLLVRAQDFQKIISIKEEQKSPMKESEQKSSMKESEQKAPQKDIEGIKSLRKDIEPENISQVGFGKAASRRDAAKEESDVVELEGVQILSDELEAIVDREESLDIEEVESISEEMRRIGNVSSIESLKGISTEFEEIEGVSAEFEKMSRGIEGDIGSLSAEIEEIDGVSAEIDSLDADANLEKIGIKSEPLQKIGSHKPSQIFQADDDYELEELQDESAELKNVILPPSKKINPQERGKPLKAISSKQAIKDVPQSLQTPVSGKQSGQTPVLGRESGKENDRPAALQPIHFPPGDYDVMINFSGKDNFESGTQLLSKIKGISGKELAALTEQKNAIVVANHVSREAAERILSQFQKLKMQGKIIATRKK